VTLNVSFCDCFAWNIVESMRLVLQY